MARTPDQDVVDGLALATSEDSRDDPTFTLFGLAMGQHKGRLDFWTEDDYERPFVAASFTPDEAESLARVLQSWAGYTKNIKGAG